MNETSHSTGISSAETYRTIVEGVHEGAVIIDEQDRVIFLNSNFAALAGLDPAEIRGRKITDFVESSCADRFTEARAAALERSRHEQLWVRKNNGRPVEVLLTLSPLAPGRSRALSVIVTDLTAQSRYARELKQKSAELEIKNEELTRINAELSAFIFISSHDLQEPLRKIQFFVNMILDEEAPALNERTRDYFRRILKSSRRMQSMLRDLLLYSNVRSEDMVFEETDLSLLLGQVLEESEECIYQKGIEVIADPLPVINAIPSQFRQLLYHLISNAIRFSHPNREAKITVKYQCVPGKGVGSLDPDSLYHRLTVADNGFGFENRYSEKIFELFERLNNNDDNSSTGIGLPICKRVAVNHHGTIIAKGEPGNGAEFAVYVPAGRRDSP